MRKCIYMLFRTTIRDIEIVLYWQGYLFLMLLNYVIQDYFVSTKYRGIDRKASVDISSQNYAKEYGLHVENQRFSKNCVVGIRQNESQKKDCNLFLQRPNLRFVAIKLLKGAKLICFFLNGAKLICLSIAVAKIKVADSLQLDYRESMQFNLSCSVLHPAVQTFPGKS